MPDASCRTCALVARRDAGDAPAWDSILRTPGWDVVHAFGTSVEGWMVVVARRHMAAVADLTDAEARELGPLVKSVSGALHEVTGCAKTYVAQFAEAPGHRHVHVHVVPRGADLPEAEQGPRIFGRLGLSEGDSVPEARMNEIATRMRDLLLQEPQSRS